MKNKSFTVTLKCLFCDSPIEGDTQKEYMSGDLLECQNCHEFNDYDALLDSAGEEGKKIVGDHVMSEISKRFKKSFR